MFHHVRGRAVIINIKNFLKSEARAGSENDVADLRKLLAALHFIVIVHWDKTAKVINFFLFLLSCLVQIVTADISNVCIVTGVALGHVPPSTSNC